MKKILAATFITLSLWVTPLVAQTFTVEAEIMCSQFGFFEERLGTRFGEFPTARGLSKEGHLVQVFLNRDSQSFSVTQSNPISGTTCLLTIGDYWELIDEQETKGDL